jgi:recombination protein RecA
MDENRQKALESALKAIDKNFGKGTLMRLGDKPTQEIEAISTGSLGLDIALGIGGIPKGRIIEVYGPESSGKTTLALQIIAQAQKAGGICAFIDAEHALDVKYAKNLGCDVDNLLVSQPDYGEQALDIVETVGRSGAVDVIVVDSVAALTPKSEIEGDMGDAQVGVQARLMSQALRKLTGMTSKMNCTIIFINQIRMKIGMMGYGSPETTTGGNALKFYCSVRIDVRRIQTLKQGDDSIGNRVKAKVIKNKVAPPFKQAEFDIMFGEGISREGELIDYGVKLDIVDKAGTWFSYKDKKLGQGKEKSKAFLKENLDIAMEIEEGIKNAMGFDLPDLDDVETEDSE